MTQELRERVARAIAEADVTEEGSVADLMSCDGYMKTIYGFADAAIALVLEEAARVAEDMPINGHGNLAVEPYAAAKQVSDEIAAAIRALKNKP